MNQVKSIFTIRHLLRLFFLHESNVILLQHVVLRENRFLNPFLQLYCRCVTQSRVQCIRVLTYYCTPPTHKPDKSNCVTNKPKFICASYICPIKCKFTDLTSYFYFSFGFFNKKFFNLSLVKEKEFIANDNLTIKALINLSNCFQTNF